MPPVRLRTSILLLLGGAVGGAALVAVSVGAVPVPLSALLLGNLEPPQAAVLFSIRLPRVVLAAVVGAALPVSGAAMQGLFRNPLADPGLIGMASGAALAVAVAIVLAGSFVGTWGLYGLSVAAFVGGLLASLLIFRLARRTGVFSVTYLLLAGIAVNALAGAGTGFLTYLSTDRQLRALTFWAMGSLGGALWSAVGVAATLVVPATLLLVRKAGDLNLLLLGEDDARYLGVDSARLQRVVLVCVSVAVGAAVAVSGIIGFVGLVVPHLLRLTIGPDHRRLLPAAALAGALLLLVADTVARTIVAPAEMPVGILTSLIGGPFFLWLLMKHWRFGS